jgi:hypothetical protein
VSEIEKLYQNKEWLEEQFKTVKYAQVIGRSVGVTGDTIESRNQANNPKILRYMYKDATIYLDRKYKRAMELCSPLQ